MKITKMSAEEIDLNLSDLRRYQQDYYQTSNETDKVSLRAAMDFLRGERPAPNTLFYRAQDIIKDLKDHEGYTLSILSKKVNLNLSTLKKLSSGDFRAVNILYAIKVIRVLEHLVEDEYEEIKHTFVEGPSKRERRRKRKQKKSQEKEKNQN